MLATGRSLGRSVPAPFTLQGLADSTPSATAVLRLARSTWYAFGAMAGRLASREACHDRTIETVSWPSSFAPRAGST